MGGDGRHRQIAGWLRHRERGRVVGGTHRPGGQGSPVDLCGDGEEELIRQVRTGRAGVDRRVHESLGGGVGRQPGVKPPGHIVVTGREKEIPQ